MKRILLPLAAVLSLLNSATAETVVSLPNFDSEHFTVQNASSQAFLRVDSSSVLTGTNVTFGTMDNNLTLTVSNRVFLRSVKDMPAMHDCLVVGSNSVSMCSSAILMGYSNYMYIAPFASILGGTENRLVNGNTQSGNSSPYHSVIAGGYRNTITGSQNSVISGGSYNTISNASVGATIVGGSQNKALANYSTVAGGLGNETRGTNSFAAGYYAKALHDGSFVWADSSTDSSFSSTNANEFAVRAAGGFRLESELGTNALPSKKSRYADNNIVAWARVPANGILGTENFGVATCSNVSQGTYNLTLDARMQSAFHLIPVATPEVDNTPPTNATLARLIYVDQTTGVSNFTVYITRGDFVPTNSDFTFIVTGR